MDSKIRQTLSRNPMSMNSLWKTKSYKTASHRRFHLHPQVVVLAPWGNGWGGPARDARPRGCGSQSAQFIALSQDKDSKFLNTYKPVRRHGCCLLAIFEIILKRNSYPSLSHGKILGAFPLTQ